MSLLVENVKKILSYDKIIDSLYSKLCDLEVNNSVNTEEYKTIYDFIRDFRGKEEEIMKSINLGEDDVNDYLNTLFDVSRFDPDTFDDYLVATSQFDLIRFFSHITSKELVLNNESEEQCVVNVNGTNYTYDDYKGIEDDLKNGDVDHQSEAIYNALKPIFENEEFSGDDSDSVQRHVTDDLINAKNASMMELLIDRINKEENPVIRKKLIECKYHLLEISLSLENDFLDNQSYINKSLLYRGLVRAHAKDLPEEYDNLFYDNILETLTYNLSKYSSRNKEKYIDKQDEADDLLKELSLQSYIQLLDDDRYIWSINQEKDDALVATSTELDKNFITRAYKTRVIKK